MHQELTFRIKLCDIAELFLPCGHERRRSIRPSARQVSGERGAQKSGADFLIGVHAARRLRDDFVNAAQRATSGAEMRMASAASCY